MLVVTVALSTGCANEHGDPVPEKRPADVARPQQPRVFSCLKVAGKRGRTCAGPEFSPAGAKAPDLFATPEAWCVVERSSWTDPRSAVRCVPTEAECVADLYDTADGKIDFFNRHLCARTLPDQWTADHAAWPGLPDGFYCDHATPVGCDAMPGDLAIGAPKLLPEAWCFTDERLGVAVSSCYEAQRGCEGARAQATRGHDANAVPACTKQGPQVNLREGLMGRARDGTLPGLGQ